MRRLASAAVVLFGAVVALVACQGGTANPPPLDTGASQQFSVSGQSALNQPAGSGATTIPFPSSHGFSGSVTIPPPGPTPRVATLTITIQNFPPTADGVPAASVVRAPQSLKAAQPSTQAESRKQTASLPAHTTILYIGVKSNVDLTIPAGLSFSVTVPPAFVTPNTTYYIAMYDTALHDWVIYAGPSFFSGNTITFTTTTPLTLHANVTAWFALIAVAGIVTPTPTPSPSPSVSGSPTPTPTPGGGTPTPTPSPGGGTPTPTPTPGGGTPTPTPTPGGGTPTPTPTPGGGTPTPTPTPLPPTPTPTPLPPTPTPTPLPPTPTPTPTPVPFALTVSPTPTVNVNGTGASNAATIHVHETSYVGPFTFTDTCAGKATIAVKSGSSGNGTDSDYTVTGVSSVQCTVTFKDAFNQTASTNINVTTNGFQISGRKRR